MAIEDRKKLKIAIVDDSDFSRKTIAKILEGAGYKVTSELSSPGEAIKSHMQNPANLYIVDLVMPNMSGLELVLKLKETNSNINIIMMSSLNEDSIVIDSISSGANDFIKKPFGATELLMSVNRIYQMAVNEKLI